MGIWAPPYYGKSKFFAKKKKKALAKIEKFKTEIDKLRSVVAECDAEIAKNDNK